MYNDVLSINNNISNELWNCGLSIENLKLLKLVKKKKCYFDIITIY